MTVQARNEHYRQSGRRDAQTFRFQFSTSLAVHRSNSRPPLPLNRSPGFWSRKSLPAKITPADNVRSFEFTMSRLSPFKQLILIFRDIYRTPHRSFPRFSRFASDFITNNTAVFALGGNEEERGPAHVVSWRPDAEWSEKASRRVIYRGSFCACVHFSILVPFYVLPFILFLSVSLASFALFFLVCQSCSLHLRDERVRVSLEMIEEP